MAATEVICIQVKKLSSPCSTVEIEPLSSRTQVSCDAAQLSYSVSIRELRDGHVTPRRPYKHTQIRSEATHTRTMAYGGLVLAWYRLSGFSFLVGLLSLPKRISAYTLGQVTPLSTFQFTHVWREGKETLPYLQLLHNQQTDFTYTLRNTTQLVDPECSPGVEREREIQPCVWRTTRGAFMRATCPLHLNLLPDKWQHRTQSWKLHCLNIVILHAEFCSDIPKFSVKATMMAILHIPDEQQQDRQSLGENTPPPKAIPYTFFPTFGWRHEFWQTLPHYRNTISSSRWTSGLRPTAAEQTDGKELIPDQQMRVWCTDNSENK